MNILITGWEGTVGSHLLRYLEDEGHNVTCFKGDIREPHAWKTYETRIWHALIHLAAIPGVRRSFEEPELYYDHNVNGTGLAFQFADSFAEKTLYASSSNAYEWWGNPYAATKKMNEIQAMGRKAIGMRFHTVWPGRPDMLFKKLANNEVTYINMNHHRDWIHISDLCKAILMLLQNFDTVLENNPVVDIGTGNAYSVAEVAKQMGFVGEYRLDNPKGERVHTKANINPLLDIGWKPERIITNEAGNFK